MAVFLFQATAIHYMINSSRVTSDEFILRHQYQYKDIYYLLVANQNGIRALIVLEKTHFPIRHSLNRNRSPTWLDVLRHDQIIFSEIEYCVSEVYLYLGTALSLPAIIKTNHFRYETNYILPPAVRCLLNMARQSTLILPPTRKWH